MDDRVIQDIVSQLSPIAHLTYSRAYAETLTPYVGAELFPTTAKKDSMKMEYILGADRKGIVVGPSQLNTQGVTLERDSASLIQKGMFKFQPKMIMDEELIRLFLSPSQSDREHAFAQVMGNDSQTIFDSIRASVHKMRMDVLTTGEIHFHQIGTEIVDARVDYHVPDENKISTGELSAPWSDPNADIIGDIMRLQDLTEIPATRMMMSKRMMTYMFMNPAFKAAYVGQLNQSNFNLENLNNWMSMNNLPTIILNDDKYRTDVTQTRRSQLHRFFPENKVVMFPDGPLGETVIARTTEEMIAQRGLAEGTITNNDIVFMESKKVPDVANISTTGFCIAAPSFPQAANVIQIEATPATPTV